MWLFYLFGVLSDPYIFRYDQDFLCTKCDICYLSLRIKVSSNKEEEALKQLRRTVGKLLDCTSEKKNWRERQFMERFHFQKNLIILEFILKLKF